MAESRAAWGIDIGQSALKAIKVRYVESAKQIVAEAFDYIQFPKILSQPDAVPEEIVPEAMKTFLGRNDLKGDLVAISVPGQSALARFIQLPPVEAKKLPEIVKYEARQQIPFALEDVIWDYQPLGAGTEESGYLLDTEVGLFAMKRDQIFQQLRPYNEAKVEVELIQIAPLALYNVLSVDELGIRRDSAAEPGDEYYIVLDMGCDNTTLMVSNGYKIWIRNVPIGGNHFTRALTKEMKLSFAKAEHLKCNATKSPDPRAVFQALRPVFNDYVSEIQRSIGYFSSVNRQAKIAKVLGMGNAFKLAGLQKFLQQNLQYEVDRPDTFKALAGDTVVNSPLFSENLLSFAVPYGLAVQTLGLTRIRTSLLPPEITRARLIRRKKPWAVAAAAVMLAGFSMSTVGNAVSYQTVHTPQFADAQKQADDFKAEVGSKKSAYDAEIGKYKGYYTKLDGLITGRRDISWLELYNAVIDCLPQEDPNRNPDEEISKRKHISLYEISSEKSADLGTWYSKLNPEQKGFLTKAEQEAGPSGEGYIFTLRGQHWFHDKDSKQPGVQYLVHNFLNKLQQPTVHLDGYPERDLAALGIKYPTILYAKDKPVVTPMSGPVKSPVSRLQGPAGGSGLIGLLASGAPPAAGGAYGAGAGEGYSLYGDSDAAAMPGGAGYGVGAYGASPYGSGEYGASPYGGGSYGGGYGASPYGPGGMPGGPGAGPLGRPGADGTGTIPVITQTDFVIQFVVQRATSASEGDAEATATTDATTADTTTTTP